MTHFTITVALPGDTDRGDIEAALQTAMEPYYEELNVEPYVRYTAQDIVEDTQYQLYRIQHPNTKPEDWFGGELDEDGNIVSTYNPDSQWDWYVIGGRWGGHWTIKQEYAYTAAKGLTEPSSFGHSEHAADPRRVDVARIGQLEPESLDPTFALITLEGEWRESGTVLWFGQSRDEKNQAVWEAEYLCWISSLPADTWVVLVDAHI